MNPEISLQYATAPAELDDLVIGFAERRDQTSFDVSLELPTAFPLLQVMLADRYFVESASRWMTVPPTSLWAVNGPMLGRGEGRVQAFVAILTPLGRHLVQGGNASWESNHPVPAPRFNTAANRLRASRSFEERVEVANRALSDLRRTMSLAPSRRRVLELASDISRGRFRGSVTDAARIVGLGARGLHKEFVRTVGCSPKRLWSRSRFQRLLQSKHPNPWASRAADDVMLEYFDESHALRDFRNHSGLRLADYAAIKRSTGDPLVNTVIDLKAMARRIRIDARVDERRT